MIWHPTWEGTPSGNAWARHPSATVAGHNAPPIGERAATRGRSERKVAMRRRREKALSVRTLASRTGSNAGNLDALAATRSKAARTG
jgi:hypothetical protein